MPPPTEVAARYVGIAHAAVDQKERARRGNIREYFASPDVQWGWRLRRFGGCGSMGGWCVGGWVVAGGVMRTSPNGLIAHPEDVDVISWKLRDGAQRKEDRQKGSVGAIGLFYLPSRCAPATYDQYRPPVVVMGGFLNLMLWIRIPVYPMTRMMHSSMLWRDCRRN